MSDPFDPLRKPVAAEIRDIGEKRYRRHGTMKPLPGGLKMWRIDKAGTIEEVPFNKQVALHVDIGPVTATTATLDRSIYRYCMAINHKNAKRKFDKQAKEHGI